MSVLALVLILATPFGPTGRVLELSARHHGRILIPSGSFVMGSSRTEVEQAMVQCEGEGGGEICQLFENESPQREVRLGGYRIDRLEVTYGDYGRCARTGACAPSHVQLEDLRFSQPTAPVVSVTWDEAQRYCSWAGGRLPTEAEWERAARGAGRRSYPWGQYWNPRLANHLQRGELARDDDGHRHLAPVGSYPGGASPFGLEDAAGNVGEWVQDHYGDYDEAQVAPTGPAAAPARVIRGGSWRLPPAFLRVTARLPLAELERTLDVGFRCAESVRP